ncbi:MAG: DJ-1/PfpI family protein [Malacoplasma sp.]
MTNTIKNIRIAVIVANELEDMEVIIPVDIWRRAGLIVEMVSIEKKNTIVLQNSLKIYCNDTLERINLDQFNAIYLPGGKNGIQKFKDVKNCEKLIKTLIKFANDKNKWIFSLCAAPTILGELNLLSNKKITCHPSHSKLFPNNYIDEGIVMSQNFITGKSAAWALPFALFIVEVLVDKKTSEEIKKSICYNWEYKAFLDKK